MNIHNSLSLDNSATHGLQPVNQKLTTVTALPENRLSSTLLPSKSSPEKSLNTDEALELPFLLSSDDVFLFSSSAICSSIFRMVSISSLSVLSSSAVNESLFDSMVPVSYTHLDVYKRQHQCFIHGCFCFISACQFFSLRIILFLGFQISCQVTVPTLLIEYPRI